VPRKSSGIFLTHLFFSLHFISSWSGVEDHPFSMLVSTQKDRKLSCMHMYFFAQSTCVHVHDAPHLPVPVERSMFNSCRNSQGHQRRLVKNIGVYQNIGGYQDIGGTKILGESKIFKRGKRCQ